MHKDILSNTQLKMLPILEGFSKRFNLVGGTAIALQLGHRRSIDFDLFSAKTFDNQKILSTIKKYGLPQILVDETNELTLMLSDVKMTFYHYSYPIAYPVSFEDIIKMPDLLSLASMKAFALGRRAKWKDYVDLYFLLNTLGFSEVVNKAKSIYKDEFNEKLFREQLNYFEDINYSETIDYMPGFEVGDDVVKDALVEFAVF